MKYTEFKENTCSCNGCKMMCKVSPCFPTPEQIEKYEKEGIMDFFSPTMWADRENGEVHVVFAPEGHHHKTVNGIPLMRCVFHSPEDLCLLHDRGLKPTEGKLADHDDHSTDLRKHICSQWNNEEAQNIIRKYASPSFFEEAERLRGIAKLFKLVR